MGLFKQQSLYGLEERSFFQFVGILLIIFTAHLLYVNKLHTDFFGCLDIAFVLQMNCAVKLILLLFLTQQISANNNAVFALTWMAGHCETLGSTCDKIKYEQWDHQSFTTHGLWPSQQTDREYGWFNFDLFKGKPLLQEMYSYWPPQPKQGGFPHFLWEFEWKRNGQRYADIMMNLSPANFNMYGIKNRNQQLQIHYFTKTIELYKKLNVKKVPRKTYTKGQFSSLTKIPQQSFYFVCSQSGTFLEVRICYRITSTDFVTRDCAKTISNCPGQYANLKDWRSNQLVIKQEIKTPGKADSEVQEQADKLKAKIIPIYKPVEQKKIDQKLQKISVDTKGKQEKKANDSQIVIVGIETQKQKKDLKQEILVQEQKENLFQNQLQDYNSQKQVIQNRIEGSVITQKQLINTVEKYMFIVTLLVSIFWIAIIILFCRVCKKKTPDRVDGESTVQNMESKQIE